MKTRKPLPKIDPPDREVMRWMQRRSARARWKGIPPEERSRIMKAVRKGKRPKA
jgi:hypothetical protein